MKARPLPLISFPQPSNLKPGYKYSSPALAEPKRSPRKWRSTADAHGEMRYTCPGNHPQQRVQEQASRAIGHIAKLCSTRELRNVESKATCGGVKRRMGRPSWKPGEL